MGSALKTKDMYIGLKDRFLYNNDLNSIYILLALYDVEENISNIYPRYMCLKDIKKKIKSILKNRADSEHVAHNLGIIIHEDINRLELCFYLEGYQDGYKNVRFTNLLEKEVIKSYGIDYIYRSEGLGYFGSDDATCGVKEKCYRYIDENAGRQSQIENLTDEFINRIVKKKIENLDQQIEKQLKIDYDMHNIRIEEVSYTLTNEEVEKINTTILDNLILHLGKVYKEAFWIAVNDKVFRRYR
ncbi:hypothetical protein EUAN_11580 [Andreesenia angusta]|uniref:Uncharacterized protein n=1 Tax=Andreesenia angusta TaxID=39480 RepID=A0A1S1V7L4_9FIRM|nr:hypothetical protein [Andreesenia angusta]OHW62593.1 hypothetical protein EUAN_11580 [Andreesenia angusta]